MAVEFVLKDNRHYKLSEFALLKTDIDFIKKILLDLETGSPRCYLEETVPIETLSTSKLIDLYKRLVIEKDIEDIQLKLVLDADGNLQNRNEIIQETNDLVDTCNVHLHKVVDIFNS